MIRDNLQETNLIRQGFYPDLRSFIRSAKRIYPEQVDLFEESLSKLCLDRRKVTHTLSSGKKFRFRVVCAVGKPGIIGLGVGKGITYNEALDKAAKEAKKNMIVIPAIGQNSVYGPLRCGLDKKGSMRVKVLPLPEGRSITSSKNGKLYCQVGGITNVCILTGNKGRPRKGKATCKLNYFTALHEAMKNACT